MKKYIIITVLCFSAYGFSQKLYTKTGITEFKGSVEAFEPVEAKNKSTSVVFNTETGDIAALLFVKAFDFRVALMQEHFNENYMDSNTFPKATFRGKVPGLVYETMEGSKQYIISGTLNVRGKGKKVETLATFLKEGEKLKIKGAFKVKPQDFDIKIPGIVRKKIAEDIIINFEYELVQKK